MPQETDRLKLPLPLGNENVTRESINGIFEKIDAGVATQADLDTLREAVSQMDIPDASLTQKGKVQLSSKTDGTSETVAATEKAVRDARVTAISTAAADAGTKANVAVAPIIGLQNSNSVKNSAANLDLSNWTNAGPVLWVVGGQNFRGFKFFSCLDPVPANVYAILDSDPITVSPGDYNLQAMFSTAGTTSGIVQIEVHNISANTTINSMGFPLNSNWNRMNKKITIPTGVTSVKLRLVVAGSTSGAPAGTKAVTRIKFSAGSVDVPYTAEADDLALFQSVSNGKASLAAAITGKGIPTAANATFETMTRNISNISTGIKIYKTTLPRTGGSITNLSFKPRVVIVNNFTYEYTYDGVDNVWGRGSSTAILLDDGNTVISDINRSMFRSNHSYSAAGGMSSVEFGLNYVKFFMSYQNTSYDSLLNCYVIGE
ncbi:phage tail protein [Paenibacillus xylanexedens]|uniref:tail fiber protein n=1 Tax=Paenibacillus xylanexedens TaxID=528191 RepID=UPI001F21772A|nr:phage tail protein [Paenibacillus xylanexedens]MCF7756163.1 phage tail protein [Paenibacillus xylanexedens]